MTNNNARTGSFVTLLIVGSLGISLFSLWLAQVGLEPFTITGIALALLVLSVYGWMKIILHEGVRQIEAPSNQGGERP